MSETLYTTGNGHVMNASPVTAECLRCHRSGSRLAVERCLPGIVVHVTNWLSASYWGHHHYIPTNPVEGHRSHGTPCGECTLKRDRDHGPGTAWSRDIDGDWNAFRAQLPQPLNSTSAT